MLAMLRLQPTLVAMPVYDLSVVPLLLMVLEITNSKTNSDAKMVAYADDFLQQVQFQV